MKIFVKINNHKELDGYWIMNVSFEEIGHKQLYNINVFRKYQGDRWRNLEDGKKIDSELSVDVESGLEACLLKKKFIKSGGYETSQQKIDDVDLGG